MGSVKATIASLDAFDFHFFRSSEAVFDAHIIAHLIMARENLSNICMSSFIIVEFYFYILLLWCILHTQIILESWKLMALWTCRAKDFIWLDTWLPDWFPLTQLMDLLHLWGWDSKSLLFSLLSPTVFSHVRKHLDAFAGAFKDSFCLLRDYFWQLSFNPVSQLLFFIALVISHDCCYSTLSFSTMKWWTHFHFIVWLLKA